MPGKADICSVMETPCQLEARCWPEGVVPQCGTICNNVQLFHASCPLRSQLHREGQDCCRKPPKDAHEEGLRL